MSSRKHSKDSGGSSEWREYEYEYDYDTPGPYDTEGPVSTESNVPRHEGQNLTTIPETDQQYSSQNHFTTDPVDAVTAQMSNASIGSELNVPQPQANVTPKNHYRKEFAKDYQVHGQRDFKWGRVFKVLWSEPKGNGGEGGTVETMRRGRHGEKFYEKVRRFVIIDPRKGHCICLPIMTYGGRATTKPGVHANDHAIIYTDRAMLVAGEADLAKRPIRVKPYSPEHLLEPASRLNYAKVYTVEYNAKVWFIGEIHESSEWLLTAAYNEVHPPLRPRGNPPPGPLGYPLTASSSSSQYPSQYAGPYVPAPFTSNTQTTAPTNSAWQPTYTSNIATSSWDPQTSSTPYRGEGSSHQQTVYQGGGYQDRENSSSYQPPYDSSQDPRYERHDDLYDDK